VSVRHVGVGVRGGRYADPLAKLVKDIVACILRTGNVGAVVVLTDSRVGCLELGEQRVDCLNRCGKFQKRLIEKDRVRTSSSLLKNLALASL
jgi:hypothetical protein